MTILTEDQTRMLNTMGADALSDARNAGLLPDCVAVNARIAERCFWQNPAMWNEGPWFFADYINGEFRSGRVSVRKIIYPDESYVFRVVAPGGRWCDNFSEEDAKKHLKARRTADGRLVYLSDGESQSANNDYSWAISR